MQTGNAGEPIRSESTLPWVNGHAETLVIHCSDGRFQPHIDEFLERTLRLGSFDRVAVPGGPHFLLAAGWLPKFEWAGRRWVRFLVKQHGTRRIVCIGHEDCGWYKELTVGTVSIPLLRERQEGDLRKVRVVLAELFPEMAVELYYARPSERGHVEFAAVTWPS